MEESSGITVGVCDDRAERVGYERTGDRDDRGEGGCGDVYRFQEKSKHTDCLLPAAIMPETTANMPNAVLNGICAVTQGAQCTAIPVTETVISTDL